MSDPTPTGTQLVAGDLPSLIVPDAPTPATAPESLSEWGYGDTSFKILPNRNVVLTGDRYDLSGPEMPGVVPWVEAQFGIEVDPAAVRASEYPPPIAPPHAHEQFAAAMIELLGADAVTDHDETRLRHGHGHMQEEMFALQHGATFDRIPDLVLYPSTEQHVAAIVDAAQRHDVCLVPYGGGTNVSGALRCPADEARTIASVDMSRMNRVLWIDPTNRTACIQAGAIGRDIVAILAAHGYTMGHEPDSIEFSTLGGWIATHASGMKRRRYGNIEDLVLDVHAVTAQGAISRDTVTPRESTGVDARRWLLGSEGTVGIVTQAIVKVFPLPEAQVYDAILFPDFDHGLAFMYDLQRSGASAASVRLMDNVQFQLGHTLKPANDSRVAAMKSRLETFVVTKVHKFDTDELSACTIVFEGSKDEVAAQRAIAKRLAKRHGGIAAGASNGERGYQLTFSIAYLRDFVMKHWILAESFETSVPWSQAGELCARVKQRIADEHAARGLPGKPFISCRVTQMYETGVCIYFYLAIPYAGVERPSEVYSELEHCARAEILAAGGSLSHHHGVGKHRLDYLPEIVSEGTLAVHDAFKKAIDPGNVFGIGNLRTGPVER